MVDAVLARAVVGLQVCLVHARLRRGRCHRQTQRAGWAALRVPDFQFRTTKTSAGSRSSSPSRLPAPGGWPDSHSEVAHTLPARFHGPWRDADGTPIARQCRVDEVGVDKNHGELSSRLPKEGQVIGRGMTRLIIRFGDENNVICIRPHLVCALTIAGGC